MLTLKHIELGAKFFALLHLSFFAYWLLDVLQMMGFFGGK